MKKRLAVLVGTMVLVFGVTRCNATFTMRAICRGDSTPAVSDTSLVRCSTLDTLATP